MNRWWETANPWVRVLGWTVIVCLWGAVLAWICQIIANTPYPA